MEEALTNGQTEISTMESSKTTNKMEEVLTIQITSNHSKEFGRTASCFKICDCLKREIVRLNLKARITNYYLT